MTKQKQIQTRLSTTTDIVLLEEHAKMPSVFCASTSGFFFTPIAVDPDTTALIVLAACIVYNFLRDERSLSSCDETPSDVMDLPRNNNHCPEEKKMLTLKHITSGTNFESISVVRKGKWLGS